MSLTFPLLDPVLSQDPRKLIRHKLKNSLNISFLAFTIILYFSSSFSTDDYVQSYLPTICHRILIRGYDRRLTEFSISLIMSFALIIRVIYHSTKPESFDLFRFLQQNTANNEELWNRLKLSHDQLEKLKKKARIFVKLFKWSLFAIEIGANLTTLMSLFVVWNDPKESKSLVILSLVIISVAQFANWQIILAPLCHMAVISAYLSIRIQNLQAFLEMVEFWIPNSTEAGTQNQDLDGPQKNRIVPKNRTGRIILYVAARHDAICRQIDFYHVRWTHFYFFALLFMIPFNLFMLHTLLFSSDILWFHVGGYSGGVFSSALYIFYIGKSFAKHCFRLYRTRPAIYRMVRVNSNRIPLNNWIKAMSTLERLAAKERKIGFTCLKIFTVTYGTFFKVCARNSLSFEILFNYLFLEII